MAQQEGPKKTTEKAQSFQTYLDKISQEVSSNQSRLSMVLGALILLVIGILIFNYFNKDKATLGPAQKTQQEEQDVTPENLPGKYKVKQGDTLYLIAEKYYQDGFKYNEIAKANNLTDENNIEVGQVLEIPKVETMAATLKPSETPEPTESIPPAPTLSAETTWGPKITGNTYTVVEGDWLLKIAGRAYGDISAYWTLAEANNIPNPDYILPGMVLTIPR